MKATAKPNLASKWVQINHLEAHIQQQSEFY